MRRFPAEALAGVDAVVHLAAISNDPIGNAFEDVTYAINHRSTVEVARLAREAGARAFVFASSCSVYGSAEDGMRSEGSELGPLTAYARSKVMSEHDLEALADDGFAVTCLRFATACGWSDRLRLDLVLNDFVAGAIASRRISILSDGTPWRPLIHVRDMARAIDWAVDREPADGGAFLAVNAGRDDWNHQVRDLAEAVARAVPGVDVTVNPDAPPDKRSYRVSFARFRDLAPDHQPAVDLEEAIAELRDGLEGIGFADAALPGLRADAPQHPAPPAGGGPPVRGARVEERARAGRPVRGVDWAALPAAEELGRDMHALMRELFPLNRSLTGDGVRATLDALRGWMPGLEVTEVPSGTEVYDWTVPPEWNVRQAWIADASGRRVVDLADGSLHLMGYSVPVRARMGLAELRGHLHSLPEHPDRVPVPHVLLEPRLGLLPAPPRPGGAGRRRVRGGDRRRARRRREHDLRRVRAAGRRPGRGADLELGLPSLAGQRQPLRGRPGRGPGPCPGPDGPGPDATACC